MAFLHFFRGGEKQAPCGACAGDSKGWAYSPSPLRIVRLPPLRGGAPEAQRAAQKILAITISHDHLFEYPTTMSSLDIDRRNY